MMPSLSPATPGAPLKSDPATLRLIAAEKRAAGELGDADACERAASALEVIAEADRMLANVGACCHRDGNLHCSGCRSSVEAARAMLGSLTRGEAL